VFSEPTARRPGEGRARYTPLLRRVLAVNAAVLVAATALTLAVLSPAEGLSSVAVDEGVVLLVALAATLLVNLVLLRRAFSPLERLTALARTVDPARRGERLAIEGPASEATELAGEFNAMLARLEDERRESARRVLAAQEAERLRIAQELHDEVGQTLTAVLLGLQRAGRGLPADRVEALDEVAETARGTLEDVRRIALELRPEALDDLGLPSALVALGNRLAERTGVRVHRRLDPGLPPLGADVELVVYRVAQEALTNVVRHAGVREAELYLTTRDGRVTLRVLDAGPGIAADAERDSAGGLRGMRERALLIGADLSVATGPSGGTEVRLDVPVGTGARA
jgi:two-component system, NarL family, sensor histidine kinase UhpB